VRRLAARVLMDAKKQPAGDRSTVFAFELRPGEDLKSVNGVRVESDD